jgi:signal transduction histidine kinase
MPSSPPQDTKKPPQPQINSKQSDATKSVSGVGSQAKEEALIRTEKLASLGRLASIIAHEINNPVAAVMNLLFLAKNHPDCPQAVKEDLIKAEAELMRASLVTRRSLAFYRESVEPSRVCLAAVVEEALEVFETRIMAKGLTAEKRYSRADIEIFAVPGDLRQILSNLISNSLDAVDDGGCLKVRLVERSVGDTHLARIIVADNGRGVEPSAKPHIFEALFTTKESVGTGLGLWVAKQLVEKNGGSIRFRSQTQGARKGTTFVIDLPISCLGPQT